MAGVNTHSRRYPWVGRALSSIIRTWSPALSFSTCTLSLNTTARPRTDARNLRGSFNLSLPCSSFTGGEIFLEDAAGLSRLSDQGPSGHLISAQEAIQFEPHKLHATLPWDGTRLLLLSFHIGQYRNLRTEDKKYLKMQGFNIVQPPQ